MPSAASSASIASNTASTWLGPSSISSERSGRPRPRAVSRTMSNTGATRSACASLSNCQPGWISSTAGGPGGATDTVSSFIYREYRDRSNVGYGTALAEFYLIAIIIFITVLLVVGRRFARRYGALPAVAEG